MTEQEKLKRDVLSFIGRFSTDGLHPREQVIETFTCGCCFWFAYILLSRFYLKHDCEIMIDYVANHFGARIENKIYDITGDVTGAYNWQPWSKCNDKAQHDRIANDCILF